MEKYSQKDGRRKVTWKKEETHMRV